VKISNSFIEKLQALQCFLCGRTCKLSMQLNFYSVDALGCHDLCPGSAVAFSPILMLHHIHKMNKISEIKIL